MRGRARWSVWIDADNRSELMDVYSLLTEDVRYTVPTVTLLSACSESDVRRLALERLQESANHLSSK
jgi:hypothetical protein